MDQEVDGSRPSGGTNNPLKTNTKSEYWDTVATDGFGLCPDVCPELRCGVPTHHRWRRRSGSHCRWFIDSACCGRAGVAVEGAGRPSPSRMIQGSEAQGLGRLPVLGTCLLLVDANVRSASASGGGLNRSTQHTLRTSLLGFGIARSFEVAR